MELSLGLTSRSDDSSSSWGNAVWKSIAMPALPPSRRERASRERADRAAAFASRLMESETQASALDPRARCRG